MVHSLWYMILWYGEMIWRMILLFIKCCSLGLPDVAVCRPCATVWCVFSAYVDSSPFIGSCQFRGFVKNKRVSGHMRWGIAFGPRCKSLPSGMCRYLLSNILNLDPGNLNPSANIYICVCVCVVSWQSTLGYLGPAHRPWWAVWFRWNPESFTSPLILHSPRVSA